MRLRTRPALLTYLLSVCEAWNSVTSSVWWPCDNLGWELP